MLFCGNDSFRKVNRRGRKSHFCDRRSWLETLTHLFINNSIGWTSFKSKDFNLDWIGFEGQTLLRVRVISLHIGYAVVARVTHSHGDKKNYWPWRKVQSQEKSIVAEVVGVAYNRHTQLNNDWPWRVARTEVEFPQSSWSASHPFVVPVLHPEGRAPFYYKVEHLFYKEEHPFHPLLPSVIVDQSSTQGAENPFW